MLSLPTFNTTAKSLGILNVYTPFISFLLSLLCRDLKKSLVMYFAQNNQTRLQKHVVTMRFNVSTQQDVINFHSSSVDNTLFIHF